MLYNEPLDVIQLNNYKNVCNFCAIYIVFFDVFFITNTCISSVFIYFHWYLKEDNVRIRFYPCTQTTI